MLLKVLHEENNKQRHQPQYLEAARQLVFLMSTMRFPGIHHDVPPRTGGAHQNSATLSDDRLKNKKEVCREVKKACRVLMSSKSHSLRVNSVLAYESQSLVGAAPFNHDAALT